MNLRDSSHSIISGELFKNPKPVFLNPNHSFRTEETAAQRALSKCEEHPRFVRPELREALG